MSEKMGLQKGRQEMSEKRPLTRQEMANRIAMEFQDGNVVNLGIGIPTLCSNYVHHNKTIFYHIHNPNLYERLHFLKHYPEARIVQLIRNPVQSMESWLISSVEQSINNNANQSTLIS